MLTSRQGLIERERAMNTARYMMDSKVGLCVLKTNTHEDRLHDKERKKIEAQIRRKQMHFEQEKKRFLQSQMLYNFEPTIIVERPPSPEAWMHYEQAIDEDYPKKEPGYMRPIRSRIKTPSNLPTIDAFTVRSKKKTNIWEEALGDIDQTKFISTVPPSARLSQDERVDLQKGWVFHRPQSRLEDLKKEAEEMAKLKNKKDPYKMHTKKKKGDGRSKKEIIEKIAAANAALDDDGAADYSTTFITQLPTDREPKVKFSQNYKIHPSSATSGGARQHRRAANSQKLDSSFPAGFESSRVKRHSAGIQTASKNDTTVALSSPKRTATSASSVGRSAITDT
ncbi:uncharacterized protein LOC106160045 [Lingula anatina]|uniref:Uncharacterized protein LOC106160045 n=1 Tax=Lingula anatina TaxID=7574 RepID=A0A1S3IRK6_LINAN|nr:uncharacterized protein LOC106160045 [Lingula anatina]|eukprot:XP_013392012.1 uncharacterized protein LOC106160045 [Lingula anatina]